MPGQYRKIVLLVLDGLRPDAVSHMPRLHDMLRRGWRAELAHTVRPSITVAALTSLATGVSPERHGFRDTGLRNLGRLPGLQPLAGELRRLGVETSVTLGELTGSARWLAGALLRLGGVTRLIQAPRAPGCLLDRAMDRILEHGAREFSVVYLNDADVAGHAWGWMSPAYLQAARTMDRALGRVEPLLTDPATLVIVTADHGGGGVLPQDHDHPHPLNDRIPIGMVGGGVVPGQVSPEPVGLLDIPPTVLHGFGGTAPAQYQGRVLHEAFLPELVWA